MTMAGFLSRVEIVRKNIPKFNGARKRGFESMDASLSLLQLFEKIAER